MNKYTPFNTTLRLCLITLLLLALSSACAHAQAADVSEENIVKWDDLVKYTVPCSIDALFLLSTETNSMERIGHVYLEFPDQYHMYQEGFLSLPLLMDYRSFSLRNISVVHDLQTSRVSLVPIWMSPASTLAMDRSKQSFFSNVRFMEEELEITARQTFVLKITAPPFRISPGILLSNVNGHVWLEGKEARPEKIVISGTAEFAHGENKSASIIMDFHYDEFLMDSEMWKDADTAIGLFEKKDTSAGEKILETIENNIDGVTNTDTAAQ